MSKLDQIPSAPAGAPAPAIRRAGLILALDCPDAQSAEALWQQVSHLPLTAKIGLELVYHLLMAKEGDFLARLLSRGDVFIDSKLFDIGRTVAAAAKNIGQSGARFMTVHGGRFCVEAACEGREQAGRAGKNMAILGITILTDRPAEEAAVVRRACAIAEAGGDGVIASPREAAAIRRECGQEFLIITPGIRPAGSASGGQQRAATPAEAVKAGADYLVAGRPVREAADPAAAAAAILAEMAG